MISAWGIEHTISKSDFPTAVVRGAKNFRRNKPGKLRLMKEMGTRHKAQGGALHEEVNRPPHWKPNMRRAWDEGFGKSAFGIEYLIAKAKTREYHRDKKGRFASKGTRTPVAEKPQNPHSDVRGPRLTDDEYELEAESTRVDMKNMFAFEGDPKVWKHWKDQLMIAQKYYDSIGEWELGDDIDMAIMDSKRRHKAKLHRDFSRPAKKISKALKPRHVETLRRVAQGQKAVQSTGKDMPYANTDVRAGETSWARGRLALRDLGGPPGGPNTTSAKTVKQARSKMKGGLSRVQSGQRKRSMEFKPSGVGVRRKPGWTRGPRTGPKGRISGGTIRQLP